MVLQIALILLSLLVLTGGADLLVRGASSLALRFGVSALVVGLTVVAFGTSAPELVVSMKAAYQGQGDIAAGNVIGSNIFNVAAILGLSALISPMRVQLQLLRLDAPIMVGVSLLMFVILRDAKVDRLEGIVLFIGLLAYTIFNIVASRRQHAAAIDKEFEEGVPHRTKSPWIDFSLVAGGLVLLVLGSRLLVDNSVKLAQAMGISEAVIGLTIVAAGTSMPELATSMVAAFKKEADIAIGNVIGSNIFNILGILGLSAAVFPFSAPGIRMFDLNSMVFLAVLLVPMLYSGKLLSRWEGVVLLACYVGYVAFMWPK
jgi:cation:H+ antiporter